MPDFGRRSPFSRFFWLPVLFLLAAAIGIFSLYSFDLLPSWLSSAQPESSTEEHISFNASNSPVENAGSATSEVNKPDATALSTPPSAFGEKEETQTSRPQSSDNSQSAPMPAAETEKEHGQQDPTVILYSRGKPTDPDSQVVGGEITPTSPKKAQRNHTLAGQDTVVTIKLINDLAHFLVDSYWPMGTHPTADYKGISTASVQLINMRYGNQLHGFTVDANNPQQEREQIVRYFFVPSMIQGLYSLYNKPFFAALKNAVKTTSRTDNRQAFTREQAVEMFNLYGEMARDLSNAMRGYRNTHNIRSLVQGHREAFAQADYACQRFSEKADRQGVGAANLAEGCRNSITLREEAKQNLATSLQQRGRAQVLDSGSLVYVAQWLYRREENEAALAALETLFAACASRFDEAKEWALREIPPGKATVDKASPPPSPVQEQTGG